MSISKKSDFRDFWGWRFLRLNAKLLAKSDQSQLETLNLFFSAFLSLEFFRFRYFQKKTR